MIERQFDIKRRNLHNREEHRMLFLVIREIGFSEKECVEVIKNKYADYIIQSIYLLGYDRNADTKLRRYLHDKGYSASKGDVIVYSSEILKGSIQKNTDVEINVRKGDGRYDCSKLKNIV